MEIIRRMNYDWNQKIKKGKQSKNKNSQYKIIIYNRKSQNINNYYKEEKVNIDVKEQSVEKENEKSPQNIIEVESYSSPTFEKLTKKRPKKMFLIGYIFRRTSKIKGSANIRNYNMKTNNEKFM